MELNIKLSFAFILMLFLTRLGEAQQQVFDVTKFGATTNGDISKAVMDAFKEACAATSPSTIVIPKGTYPMNQVKLQGPCKAPLELQVQATLMPPRIISNSMVMVNGSRLIILIGSHFTAPVFLMAKNLSFNFLTNSTIRDITSKDSKMFHVNVNGCKNLTFIGVKITAPQESINTDGIHVARSSNVNITDCEIGTGDDRISIGDELEQLHITKVTCGPGHGISVGSLGKTPGEKPVVGVYTWPASHQGVVTDLHFEDIIVQNVSNPVVIDQVYCPYNQCNKDISKVSIKNVRGTSRTQDVILLLCSKGVSCEGVEVGDIDISYGGKEGPSKSICENVNPSFVGKRESTCLCFGARYG
ncbi:unnamed protein product [Withania somnifera]